MLTGAFVLVGFSWNAVASASADCLLLASWPMAWTPPPPACDCVADWDVRFRFPASAPASAALVWVTEPLPPALPMRTGVLVFDGAICVAVRVRVRVLLVVRELADGLDGSAVAAALRVIRRPGTASAD